MLKRFFLIILCFTTFIYAVEIDSSKIEITNFPLYIFKDIQNTQTIDSIQKVKFLNTTTSKQSLGFSDATIWLKTDIEVKTDIKNIYIQQVDAVNIMDITFYLFQNDKLIQEKRGGINYKQSKSSELLMIVPVKKGTTYTLYAKLKSTSMFLVDLNIFDAEQYLSYKKYEGLLFGLFLGFATALLIYNLFLYYSLRYPIYIYYSGWLASAIVFKSSQSGIPIEYFSMPSELYTLLYYFIFPMGILSTMFMQRILNTKIYLPFMHKVLNFIIYSSIATPFVVIFFIGIDNYIFDIYMTIFYAEFFYIVLIIQGIRKKVPGILYFSIATIPFMLAVFRSQLLFFGWIDYSLYARFGHLGVLVYESIAYALLLSYYIKKLTEENALQKALLIQTEKQESLGELLIYITHQWKAPLARLGQLVTLNEAKLKKGIDISKEDLQNTLVRSRHSINFMADTVSNFSNFYMPEKNHSKFRILDSINTVWQIVEKDFLSVNIKLTIKGDEDILYYGVANDISQIILTLLSNSKQVIVKRGIENPTIDISVYETNSCVFFEVEDNAGGITKEKRKKIFDIYVGEEKRDNKKSGLGLYLSKNIVDNYDGKIEAINTKNGLNIKVTLPKDKG